MKKVLIFFLLALPMGMFIVPEGALALKSSSDSGVSQEMQSSGPQVAKMMGETEHGKAYAEREARWHNPWEREHRYYSKWGSRWHPRRHSPKSALYQITGDFHLWIECLMAERDDLDLSPDQSARLDKTLTDYFRNLIETEAAAFSAMVQLKYDLRQPKVDLPSVQTQLKEISEKEYSIQLSAIKTYLSILDILTPPQRQKLDESIGSAFPSMWHPMRQWEPWKAEGEHEWESKEHEKEGKD